MLCFSGMTLTGRYTKPTPFFLQLKIWFKNRRSMCWTHQRALILKCVPCYHGSPSCYNLGWILQWHFCSGAHWSWILWCHCSPEHPRCPCHVCLLHLCFPLAWLWPATSPCHQHSFCIPYLPSSVHSTTVSTVFFCQIQIFQSILSREVYPLPTEWIE